MSRKITIGIGIGPAENGNYHDQDNKPQDHHNQPTSHKLLPVCLRRLARVLTGLKYFSMPTVRWKEAFPAPATPSLRSTVEVWWIVPRGMYST